MPEQNQVPRDTTDLHAGQAPVFEKIALSDRERYLLAPFFTNLDRSVFAVTFLPPEVIGALCSRTSRAKEDLRQVFLSEFVKPFVEQKDEYGKSLNALISAREG